MLSFITLRLCINEKRIAVTRELKLTFIFLPFSNFYGTSFKFKNANADCSILYSASVSRYICMLICEQLSVCSIINQAQNGVCTPYFMFEQIRFNVIIKLCWCTYLRSYITFSQCAQAIRCLHSLNFHTVRCVHTTQRSVQHIQRLETP